MKKASRVRFFLALVLFSLTGQIARIVENGAAILKNAETVLGDNGTLSLVPNENIFLAVLLAALVLAVFRIPVFRAIRKSQAASL